MRKSIVIILAVAVIGALAIYGKNQPSRSAAPTHTAVHSAATGAHPTSTYNDGRYRGDTAFTPYGPVQIAVIVSGGKITDVQFLQMPGDVGHSREVTAASEPLLKQQTLQNQNIHIDFISGATSTSQGYEQSLQAALNQAA